MVLQYCLDPDNHCFIWEGWEEFKEINDIEPGQKIYVRAVNVGEWKGVTVSEEWG